MRSKGLLANFKNQYVKIVKDTRNASTGSVDTFYINRDTLLFDNVVLRGYIRSLSEHGLFDRLLRNSGTKWSFLTNNLNCSKAHLKYDRSDSIVSAVLLYAITLVLITILANIDDIAIITTRIKEEREKRKYIKSRGIL